jgi:4-amino-4-deoxy-L-arabinose transferase-like glycosyltransferase
LTGRTEVAAAAVAVRRAAIGIRLPSASARIDMRAAALETIMVVAFLGLALLAYGYRLGSVIVPDMDEGTYLLAGRLVAGGAVPYRDFMLTHPPAIAYLIASWISFAGPSIVAARIANAVLVLVSTIPLYLLARSLTRSRAGGLLALGSYVVGMLLLANMGRTIRLEPIMNAALIAGTYAYLRPRPTARWTVIAGALFAIATMVKLVAVVPVLSLLVTDVLWRRDGLLRRWATLAAAAAAALIPIAAVLVAQPRFLDDVLFAQLDRPGLPLLVRVSYLAQDLIRDPLLGLGLVASGVFVVRASDVRLRALSLVALVSTACLTLAFRTFFGYYLVQVLPWLSISIAAGLVGVARATRPPLRRWSMPAIAVGALSLATAVPLAYEEYYDRTAHDHVSSAKEILAGLRDGAGPVYSMYPSFPLWSGRQACGTYYVADSLIPRITGRIGDDDFVSLFSSCSALVLWPGELDGYLKANAYVRENFALRIANGDYALWVRRSSR